MRSSKRRSPQPLNFTPDEPQKGRSSPDRSGFGPMPKPVSLRAPLPEPTDALLGVSPATRRGAPDLGLARHAYLFAAVASLAWAGMLVAYTIGYVGGLSGLARAPMQLAVIVLMAVLPAMFIFAGAFAARQGAKLASEARWVRSLAEDMMTPAALAAARTGDIAATVRAEVERVSAAAIAAHGQLISVRDALAGETERLSDTAAQAQLTARTVGETLTREREEVTGLLASLRDHAQGLASGVERQSRLVAEASDLARSQLQEAEATLASGAERLAAASADAGAAARDAGEGLTRQAERLDVAAAALSERLRFLDARLNEQRHALASLLSTLDTDQDDLAARLETHQARMAEVIADARAGAAELAAASSEGAEAMRGLVGAARDEARDLAARVRADQGALRIEAAEARQEAQAELHRTLDAVARAGEDARRALAAEAQAAQTSASARVGAARAEVEQLGELAFAAGQRADQAFQARLAEARRMIDQTAALVEEAGARAGQRIEAGLGASRGALGDLTGALGEIDAQLARLPDAARQQAEAVRAGVERSLSDLTASARRATEETQAIDAAFQDRIRRNYETLSEAVRLMGRVAGSVDFSRDLAPPRSAAPSPPAAPPAAAPTAAPAAAIVQPPRVEGAPDPLLTGFDPFAALRRPAEPSVPPRTEIAPPPERKAPAFTPARPPAPSPVFGRAAAREAEAALASAGPADLLLEPEHRSDAPVTASLAVEPAPVAPAPLEPALVEPAPVEPAPVAPAPVQPSAEHGLRPRLKFTPTEADEALKAVFAPAPPRAEPEAATGARVARGRSEWDSDMDEWTWKDLLTSMDEAPKDTDALAAQMIREIEALGVDAAALLPRARLEDVAAALTSGDAPAARDAVRRLAPAAIRRLSRRVLTDKALREQVDRFVGRYQALLGDGQGGTEDVQAASTLLATDAGRAYLLLEAAVGDF